MKNEVWHCPLFYFSLGPSLHKTSFSFNFTTSLMFSKFYFFANKFWFLVCRKDHILNYSYQSYEVLKTCFFFENEKNNVLLNIFLEKQFIDNFYVTLQIMRQQSE